MITGRWGTTFGGPARPDGRRRWDRSWASPIPAGRTRLSGRGTSTPAPVRCTSKANASTRPESPHRSGLTAVSTDDDSGFSYQYGEMHGDVDIVRVEEVHAAAPFDPQSLKPRIAAFRRSITARSRPASAANARRLRERGESLDSIVFSRRRRGRHPGAFRASRHDVERDLQHHARTDRRHAHGAVESDLRQRTPAGFRARARGPDRAADRVHVGQAGRRRVRGPVEQDLLALGISRPRTRPPNDGRDGAPLPRFRGIHSFILFAELKADARILRPHGRRTSARRAGPVQRSVRVAGCAEADRVR